MVRDRYLTGECKIFDSSSSLTDLTVRVGYGIFGNVLEQKGWSKLNKEAVAKEGVSLDLIMLGGNQSICNYVSFSDDKGKP